MARLSSCLSFLSYHSVQTSNVFRNRGKTHNIFLQPLLFLTGHLGLGLCNKLGRVNTNRYHWMSTTHLFQELLLLLEVLYILGLGHDNFSIGVERMRSIIKSLERFVSLPLPFLTGPTGRLAGFGVVSLMDWHEEVAWILIDSIR